MKFDRLPEFTEGEDKNGTMNSVQSRSFDNEMHTLPAREMHELCVEFDRQVDGLLRQASRELKN